MPDYRVTKEGWINGRLRRVGERVWMTIAQAKYENVAPVEDAAPDAAPEASPAPKRGGKGGAA